MTLDRDGIWAGLKGHSAYLLSSLPLTIASFTPRCSWSASAPAPW